MRSFIRVERISQISVKTNYTVIILLITVQSAVEYIEIQR